MRFDEQLHVPVSIDAAWEFLWDTKRLAGCLPGCTNVLELEPGKRYKAQFEDHIGPYKVHFGLCLRPGLRGARLHLPALKPQQAELVGRMGERWQEPLLLLEPPLGADEAQRRVLCALACPHGPTSWVMVALWVPAKALPGTNSE